MIRVRTVDHGAFGSECARLWHMVRQQFPPYLVVGIRSGGWWVAEAMRAADISPGIAFLPLTIRRPVTSTKEHSRLFRLALRHLPYPVLDAMRRVEYYAVTLPRCRSVSQGGLRHSATADPAELADVKAAAAQLPPNARVLVVDDSLDSGATLWNVVTTLRQVLPDDASIQTAAFTVLGPAHIVAADFFLYHRINFRFPWSYDFHG